MLTTSEWNPQTGHLVTYVKLESHTSVLPLQNSSFGKLITALCSHVITSHCAIHMFVTGYVKIF